MNNEQVCKEMQKVLKLKGYSPITAKSYKIDTQLPPIYSKQVQISDTFRIYWDIVITRLQ